MYIYKNKQNDSEHILDPDYIYHDSFEEGQLYSFYKNLVKPEHIDMIAGIYIQYDILPFSFEEYPSLYEHFNKSAEKLIAHFLDKYHANLYCHQTHSFFLVMFDPDKEELPKLMLRLYEKFSEIEYIYKNKKCQFQIRFGVYLSHKYVNPFTLFEIAKEQHENTLLHHSILSVK